MKLNVESSSVYYFFEALTAVGTVIVAVYKFIPKVISKFKQYFVKNTELYNKIDIIFKELTPNHGSSLKDKINKMEINLEENTILTEKILYRQKWMLDHQDTPIFESNAEGKCIWVNTKYRELFKQDVSYFLGNGWKNSIFEADRDKVVAEWEKCVKDARLSENTYRMVDSDGKIYNVYCVATRTDKHGYLGTIKIL